MDIIRDAPIGQLIRLLTRNRVLKYPEEEPGFQCPVCYQSTDGERVDASEPTPNSAEKTNDVIPGEEEKLEEQPEEKRDDDDVAPDEQPYETPAHEFEPIRPGSAGSRTSSAPYAGSRRTSLTRIDTRLALHKSVTRADLEQQFADAVNAEKETVERIEPDKLECGTIVVDWYDTADPANPQNWRIRKKIFVSSVI
jgi:MFS transporter, DHA1 family, multidrug resistance protein